MEGLLPKKYGDDAVEIPGARALLQELIDRKKPWAIVTSGSMPLVSGVSNSEFFILDPTPILQLTRRCSAIFSSCLRHCALACSLTISLPFDLYLDTLSLKPFSPFTLPLVVLLPVAICHFVWALRPFI